MTSEMLPDAYPCAVSKHENDIDDTKFEVEFSAPISGNWLGGLINAALREGLTVNNGHDHLIIDGKPLRARVAERDELRAEVAKWVIAHREGGGSGP